ncbi:transposase [Sphingomonas sp. BE138]|uniref:IS1182 family transposase n=1 Tax=Sphingomonas sp. BE138 TaxID=2817845 RepID=UPI002863F248|nr:IS1182 family transposase [Sphingomonas sp. BE138]MDR6789159.1 transposase [Sphingomonas sp. BE138]
MAYIEGHARDQALLLPALVEDYVAADNPVRFIDAFVDDLDLGGAGFMRSRPKATGRPGYDPADMLKLYLYGYLNRVRSSRRLAAEAARNLELIWLLRGVRPDFRTIADFRRDNRGAFKAVFREFVVLCRRLDLFGRELLAVDGTRLKAVNSRSRNFSRERLTTYLAAADARLERYLAELDQIDRGEDGAGTGRGEALATKIARLREQRQASAALLGQLEESGEGQISLTDPDARLMVAHSKVTLGYNAQVAVDAKHSLIVEQHVTNACNDMGLLAPTAGAAKKALGVDRIDAVADMGYHSGDDIVACEAAGITPYIPRPHRGTAVGNGLFPKERFRYDPEADVYHCPGGQVLDTRYASVTRGHRSVQYSSPAACAACQIKARCTTGRWRRINRGEHEPVIERMAVRLAKRPGILTIRKSTVEHPFGSIKQWMNQGAFLMRGLDKVRAEFSLTALAYNLRRAITLIGVPGLIRAVQA